MYCIKCGRELENEANFCPVCGTKRVETENAPSAKPRQSEKKTIGPVKGKKLLVVCVAALAALALCLIIFGGGGVQHSKAADSSTAAAGQEASASETTPAPTAKPTPKATAKPSPSPKASSDGESGLVTKDELKDKYSSSSNSNSSSGGALQALIEKYSTPAPTATPKDSTSKGVKIEDLVEKYSGKATPKPEYDGPHLQDIIDMYFPAESEQVSGATESSESSSRSCSSCGGSGDCRSCGGKGGKNRWTGDSYVWQDCSFCSNGNCPYC